jgi:hypothetical protein
MGQTCNVICGCFNRPVDAILIPFAARVLCSSCCSLLCRLQSTVRIRGSGCLGLLLQVSYGTWFGANTEFIHGIQVGILWQQFPVSHVPCWCLVECYAACHWPGSIRHLGNQSASRWRMLSTASAR